MLTQEWITQKYLRMKQFQAQREDRPLDYFHFAVPRLRDAFSLFSSDEPIDELLARGPNGTGKTYSVAAFLASCAMKRTTLDGVPIPQWRGRVEGVQLVQDYKQQLLSVQPAWLRVLGTYPHRARYVGESLTSLHIKPIGGSEQERSWSVVHFLSEKNLTSGVGVRADFVGFDEPPPLAMIQELRKAAHANRRLVMVIDMTPTIRRQWAPIQQDYGDTPRRTLRRVDRDRAEVRWSLDEVAEWVLSEERKQQLLRKYLGPEMDWKHPRDPLALARIHGDYAITDGSCPFQIPTLEAMLKECVEPVETIQWEVKQEANDGTPHVTRTIPVEVWKPPRLEKSYWITIDPSSGTDDPRHDPFEIHVTEDSTGDLCARTGGYLSGNLIGALAAGMARQYNNAPIDVEANDRWAVNVVHGVQNAGYGNWAKERRELNPGEWDDRIGFHNNQNTRPVIIGAVQTWIDNRMAGIRYGECPSRFVIETLLNCVLNEKGKIVGAPGVHDEALIVRGQALRKAVRRMGMEIPAFNPPVKTDEQRLFERLTSSQRRIPARGPVPVSRSRV
jgi:hypothetical protein